MKTIGRVLEPGLERGSTSGYLRTQGEAYRFVPEDCSVDVDQFLGARQAGAMAEGRGDRAAAIRAYQEADALSRAWARAAVQAGHFLMVRGSAGMGKTRLAEQFAQRLGPGVGVLWMAAHEPEVELPFAPVLGLLGNWLERSATPALVRRLGPHAPVLAHLLPQVRASWPEGGGSPAGPLRLQWALTLPGRPPWPSLRA